MSLGQQPLSFHNKKREKEKEKVVYTARETHDDICNFSTVFFCGDCVWKSIVKVCLLCLCFVSVGG